MKPQRLKYLFVIIFWALKGVLTSLKSLHCLGPNIAPPNALVNFIPEPSKYRIDIIKVMDFLKILLKFSKNLNLRSFQGLDLKKTQKFGWKLVGWLLEPKVASDTFINIGEKAQFDSLSTIYRVFLTLHLRSQIQPCWLFK